MNATKPGPRARRAAPKVLASLAATAIAALVAACGQTPGQTGLDYVEAQGVRVSAPLYRLTLENLPVDTVFGSEVPLSHYGESLLVVGRMGDFEARARMGFRINTKSQRDSLAHGLHLRLSPIPLSGILGGRNHLRESARNHDTLRILVESFSWVDSTNHYNDSLRHFHRLLLSNPVPMSAMAPAGLRRDTIVVLPSRAYPDTGVAQDSSRAGALPNLLARLRNEHGGDSTRNWLVYVELSPLSPADSGLFRFDLRASGQREGIRRAQMSGLWIGRYVPDSIARVGLQLPPYLFNATAGFTGTLASGYQTRYTGPNAHTVLHNVARGVHLRVNRDTLASRVKAALNAYIPGDPTLGDRLFASNGLGADFDRRFYVPYAVLRLPVDTAATRMEGPFAYDMNLVSDLDSTTGDTASFVAERAIATGDSLLLAVSSGSGSTLLSDMLVASYRVHPVDTTLRQVLVHWSGAPTLADTFVTEPDGRFRELTLRRRTGWPRPPVLAVTPEASALRVRSYFNAASVDEPRDFIDSTGRTVISNRGRSARFLRPGADTLAVRATNGIRMLLGRTSGADFTPDMFLRSTERAVYDTATISDDQSYRTVVYPVMGEMELKRSPGGRLEAGLDLYLYPLDARP